MSKVREYVKMKKRARSRNADMGRRRNAEWEDEEMKNPTRQRVGRLKTQGRYDVVLVYSLLQVILD